MSETVFEVATRRLGAGLDALEAALRLGGVPNGTVLDLRLVAEEVSALTERFKALARELGGHYDGWTVRRGA